MKTFITTILISAFMFAVPFSIGVANAEDTCDDVTNQQFLILNELEAHYSSFIKQELTDAQIMRVGTLSLQLRYLNDIYRQYCEGTPS